VDAAVLVALLVGYEQLDRVAEDGIRKLGGGRELLELAAEVRAEQLVDCGQHLRARAVVQRERERLSDRFAPLAEDLHVGVAEAVDGLELVADEEQFRLRGPQQVDDLGLQAVRVLELVHEDRAEALLLALAQLRLGPQQVARLELEVLEVERRFACLRLGVPLGEKRQQLLQERAVARRGLVESGLLDRAERLAVGRGSVPASPEAAEAHQPVRPQIASQQLEQLGGRALLRLCRVRVGDERGGSGAQLVHTLSELRPRRHGQVELAPRRAQRLVHARQHPAQPVAPVGGEKLEPLWVVSRAELGECLAERLRPKHGGLRLVELAEARVEPSGERICPQQAGAEAVDRRDPGSVELTCKVVPSALGERRPDPHAQLARRAARVGDDEDRVDVEPALRNRAHDPLDEHGSLPGACARGDEDLAGGLDRSGLLVVELERAHGRSIRHTVQRSHQAGHSPPSGS
jgi:aryl carrier-like protein